MKLALLAAIVLSLPFAFAAESVDVTVRHAPYLVSTNKEKRESAWAPCRYCGSKTNYERVYEWDAYKQVWVEKTKAESVPNVCRHCRLKLKDQEDLDRKERDIDRKIDYEESRLRIKKKKGRLSTLRKKAR